jgi:hypothetical protein
MAKRTTKRTPEEQAEYDRRTELLLAAMEKWQRRAELAEAERARAEERRRRLKRILTLGLAS